MSTSEIGALLFLSEATVKLDPARPVQVAVLAYESGLVRPGEDPHPPTRSVSNGPHHHGQCVSSPRSLSPSSATPSTPFLRLPSARSAGFNGATHHGGMRIPLVMLMALAAYFVWATTFAVPAATSVHP